MEQKKYKKLRKAVDRLLRAGNFWRGRPKLRTVTYPLKSSKITAPVTLAIVTDLHSCYYGEQMQELTEAVRRQTPDVVLLGGDIFDEALPIQNAQCFLSAIAKEYPCYYVSGNHERRSGKLEEYKAWLRTIGVCVLACSYDVKNIRGTQLCFCGVDDPSVHGHEVMHAQLAQLARDTDKRLYRILLTHRPEKAQRYMDCGFDLAVAGHAHGGQWRIPGLINGLYAPGQGFFPKLAGGKYIYETGTMIVSRGLARETTWVPRIGNRPELVIVQLQNEG